MTITGALMGQPRRSDPSLAQLIDLEHFPNWIPPLLENASTSKAPFGGATRMVLCTMRSTHAERSHHMNVQSFLHTIDGVSTWVGKAAAWLIILLMGAVCIEVFKRYIMNMP